MKRDITVASVQFNHHAGDKAYNLSVIEHYVQQAADSGVEIISFRRCVLLATGMCLLCRELRLKR